MVTAVMDNDTLKIDPTASPAGYRLVICQQGSITFNSQDTTIVCGPGEGLLLDTDTSATVVGQAQTIHWVYTLRGSLPIRIKLAIPTGLHPPLLIDSIYLKILLRLSQTMMQEILSKENDYDNYLSQIITDAIVAAVRDHGHPRIKPVATEVTLLSRAMELIHVRAADPEFCISTLATMLDISQRQLQRVFEQANTSPSQALLNARTDLLHTLIREDPRRALNTDLATMSGFLSRRAMIQCLRRDERFTRLSSAWEEDPLIPRTSPRRQAPLKEEGSPPSRVREMPDW